MKILQTVCGALLAACWAVSAMASDQVTVQLDFLLRGNHGIFFVGKSEGFFAKNGINIVAINKGTGSVNTIRQIGSGSGDFGFADLPTLAITRSQNTPVVAIAAVNQKSPMAIIALKKTKLSTPKDLEGKSIGVFAVGSTFLFFKAFAAANQLDLNKIEVRTITPPSENFLLLGRADVIPGYIDAELPELEAKAGGPGSLNILLGYENGFVAFGSGLITSEKTINDRPDLVRRFVRAYLQAFAFTIKNPEKAADAIIAENPEFAGRRNVLIAQLKADIAKTFTSEATREHGLGYMPESVSKATVDMLVAQRMIPAPIDLSKAFNNSFIKDAPKM
ncbi:MAG: ABC transporter substrate-binding protein [Pseudorhodoplanes sp.]|nr:ABC transporter substrate-binding protein [Pseudorhodoplanes sp.]